MSHIMMHSHCSRLDAVNQPCQSWRQQAGKPISLKFSRCSFFTGPVRQGRRESRKQVVTNFNVEIPTKTPAPGKKRGRKVKEHPAQLPGAGFYQQTLKQSFTIGGLGMHTGEYAYVRVRPAFAGEGRYFVRVPEGTNCSRFHLDEPEEIDMEGKGETATEDQEDASLELFYDFLRAQEEEEYDGTFAEFAMEYSDEAERLLAPLAEEELEEEVLGRSADDEYVAATLANVIQSSPVHTILGEGDSSVASVEHLLAALEACGVDNARIEIEGGSEIPIVDGSAVGWTLACIKVGVHQAVSQETGEKVKRMVLAPSEILTVQEGDAWISFYPDSLTKLTAGVDCAAESPIIGKQWFSWCAEEDAHFRHEIAPARTYAASLTSLLELRSAGYYKGGTEDSAIIGFGDRWYQPHLVRFFDDEPSRHKVIDLMGDLSLLAVDGSGGTPVGHVVAHKADHNLQIRFARALQQAAKENFVPTPASKVNLGANEIAETHGWGAETPP